MKKTLLTLIYLQFIVLQSFSQNSSEEYNSIQKFIESTVQIPFMARVADVQGTVNVRITMGTDSLPIKYEVVKKLRPDCDLEALRVVKLVNIKMLREVLNGKKKILLEVPFFNKTPISYGNGFFIEYFDKNNKRTVNEPDIKLARRYSVDSLTGIINSNVDYFEYRKGKIEPLGIAILKIDSSNKNIPNFLESPADTVRYRSLFAFLNNQLPPLKLSDIFDNGLLRTVNTEDSRMVYYPNGRIESIDFFSEKDKEKTTDSYKWYANGQLESIKVSTKNEKSYTEKIVSVWDTSGHALVVNGNGVNQAYYQKNRELYTESGVVKDSLKVGKWISQSSKGVIDFEEIYKNGVLIEGKSYEGTTVYPYKGEQNAEYKGGIPRFGDFLSNNLSYPSAAQRSNIEGQVYVQFVVCTDGTLCDYKVLRGIGFGCDEEALRVIKLSSGKWKPGSQRGKSVRSRFTIPINFKLTR
jgi:TonB family protein